MTCPSTIRSTNADFEMRCDDEAGHDLHRFETDKGTTSWTGNTVSEAIRADITLLLDAVDAVVSDPRESERYIGWYREAQIRVADWLQSGETQ